MKQYFNYFKIFFIILAVMLVITGVVALIRYVPKTEGEGRQNSECSTERVYDYADVLTADEEEALRRQIAETEEKIACDLVLVTLKESVLENYGYTENTDANWEDAMERYADDFYDENLYGYNKVYGDGAILVDNWYEGEAGSHFGTCGSVYETYSVSMINDLLDDVYWWVESDPYEAYKAYIEHVEETMSWEDDSAYGTSISVGACFLIGLIPAIIFIMSHLKNKEGLKTTTLNTYVDREKNGAPRFLVQRDELIDKRVTSRKIETNNSSGGRSSYSGGRSSGGGGGHRSSSGVRHGGGSRRR